MRVMVLLCAVWLTGCTHTKVVTMKVGAENRVREDLLRAFEDQTWISVSVFIITYPADERMISSREPLRGDRYSSLHQDLTHEFETERSSFLTPDRADEILKLASERSSVQVVEMLRVRTVVGRPVSVGFGIPAIAVARGERPGFFVRLQPQEVSHSSATVEYRVAEFVTHDTSPVVQDESWEITGRAELGLGKCYLRTAASNDDGFNVAVLLRLMSVSQPCREETEEAGVTCTTAETSAVVISDVPQAPGHPFTPQPASSVEHERP